MTNFVKTTNFLSKDSMQTSNPLKTIRGSELDTEFNNLQTVSTTKADLNSPTFTGTATFNNVTISGTSNITEINGGTY
jgi:hypothetical protein